MNLSISKKQGLIAEVIAKLKDPNSEIDEDIIIELLVDYDRDLEIVRMVKLQAKAQKLQKLEKELYQIFYQNLDFNEEDFDV